jgi:hypothetical protein
MGWSLGFDDRWQRWIGYGVTAYCDAPKCNEEIDRGLSYVCGGQEPYGGEYGCGLYFCSNHLFYHKFRYAERSGEFCKRCIAHKRSYNPKPEHPEWLDHLLTDESWAEWRKENPEFVETHAHPTFLPAPQAVS